MELFAMLGETLWYVVFFVLALSIIVAIHEYGHYIVGRWSGIHADVFSLGFGKVLFSRVDKRGTRWQLAALPFGGYVKFAGDANAASVGSGGVADLTAAERRRTMEGAPLWARALTVAAGPFANFLLTFVVLAGTMLWTGIPNEPPTISRLTPIPQAQVLAPNDVILSINGVQTPDAAALGRALSDLPREPLVAFRVERNGQELDLMAPHPQPVIVGGVQVKSAAIDAGLRTGDVILKAAGRDLITFADLQDVVFNSEGAAIPLTVWRAGETFELSLTPRRRDLPKEDGTGFETRWMMGLYSGITWEFATHSPGLWETAQASVSQIWLMITMTMQGMWHMIVGAISTCNMSGVVGMAEVMGDAAKGGSLDFLAMMATLSLGVGLLNLFPIPVLDGGHLVFYAYEAVTGRKPTEGALRFLMSIGVTLLFSLMAFALWQDLTCV